MPASPMLCFTCALHAAPHLQVDPMCTPSWICVGGTAEGRRGCADMTMELKRREREAKNKLDKISQGPSDCPGSRAHYCMYGNGQKCTMLHASVPICGRERGDARPGMQRWRASSKHSSSRRKRSRSCLRCRSSFQMNCRSYKPSSRVRRKIMRMPALL